MGMYTELILFQFHTGSIKANGAKGKMASVTMFQFHTGSIKARG